MNTWSKEKNKIMNSRDHKKAPSSSISLYPFSKGCTGACSTCRASAAQNIHWLQVFLLLRINTSRLAQSTRVENTV